MSKLQLDSVLTPDPSPMSRRGWNSTLAAIVAIEGVYYIILPWASTPGVDPEKKEGRDVGHDPTTPIPTSPLLFGMNFYAHLFPFLFLVDV